MKVLVVEDEVALADAIRRGLVAEGFEVDLVHNGREGLELGLERRHDAVVLDILLPGMNGYKVCENLRAAEVWTPILMLTAKDGEYDEAEALDTGADDFLSKPFSFVVLVARLRALGRRTQVRAQTLSVGSLTLDPATMSCTRDGQEIALTPRECSLLEALLKRDGAVAPKQELLTEVWGEGFQGDPNIVEVYVGYLRKKIDADHDHKIIQTVRGIGYRLVGEPAG
ncbi:MAG TPA: response regulator transcription factor [Acidimicrobiia bacterium]